MLVCSGFLFFRADSFSTALVMYKKMFTTWNLPEFLNGGLFGLGLDWIEMTIAVTSLLILLTVSVLQQNTSVRDVLARKNIVVRWMILYALLFYTILLGYYGPGYSAAEFIYQGF